MAGLFGRDDELELVCESPADEGGASNVADDEPEVEAAAH